MKGLLIISVACLATGSLAMLDQNTKDMMDKYNLFVSCFGEKSTKQYYKAIMDSCHYCMDEATPNDLFNEVGQYEMNVLHWNI